VIIVLTDTLINNPRGEIGPDSSDRSNRYARNALNTDYPLDRVKGASLQQVSVTHYVLVK